MAPVTRTRRSEQGHVLVIVAVMGVLAMALWGQAWRATHDGIRLERFERLRDERSRAIEPALEAMVDLLRTGRPPTDPYECVVVVSEGPGVEWAVKATLASEGDADHWSVDCRFATEAEAGTLPAAPATFEVPP